MAYDNPINDTDATPLLEEHIETGLMDLLASYKPAFVPGGDTKDDLLKRFTLFPSRQLPDLCHTYAQAFEASDNFNNARQVYGLVCDNNLPYRQQAFTELNGFVHPNLSAVLGAGTVNCSHLGESRHVIFVERPAGARLSEFIKAQSRMHEHKVIDAVLQPACKALMALAEKKISHGNICPSTFYIGETPLLGECISSPCGTRGHYLYEPLERLMADPLGHGEATEKADVYALGILAFELMYGLDKVKAIPKDEFIKRVISLGTYHVFTNNRDFSDAYQDLFRGILNDNPAERWGVDQLNQWINGKRFNMIAPTAPKEAARPIEFATESFLSRRLLANAFHRNWREALKDIRALKLDRWCEMSLHRPELAERVERATRFVGEASNEKQLHEMMTRVITILDPIGPLRTSVLSVRPDAVGTVLCEAMRLEANELPQVLSLIEGDAVPFWVDQLDSNKTPDMSQTVFRVQKAKPFLKNKAIGFGIERTLYELNPSLSCQSPLLKPYHVTGYVELLKTLDALAPILASDTSFADRHIAAFVASKIDMGKEVRLNDLENIPQLMNNPELIVLRILSKAQQKHAKLVLVGLSAWAATRVEKMIDEIHNRVIRKRLKLQLRKLASSGTINEVLAALINRNIIAHDYDGYTQAIALHQYNQQRIDRLKNPEIIQYKATKMGGKIGMTVSYAILTVIGFITLSDVLGI